MTIAVDLSGSERWRLSPALPPYSLSFLDFFFLFFSPSGPVTARTAGAASAFCTDTSGTSAPALAEQNKTPHTIDHMADPARLIVLLQHAASQIPLTSLLRFFFFLWDSPPAVAAGCGMGIGAGAGAGARAAGLGGGATSASSSSSSLSPEIPLDDSSPSAMAIAAISDGCRAASPLACAAFDACIIQCSSQRGQECPKRFHCSSQLTNNVCASTTEVAFQKCSCGRPDGKVNTGQMHCTCASLWS